MAWGDFQGPHPLYECSVYYLCENPIQTVCGIVQSVNQMHPAKLLLHVHV